MVTFYYNCFPRPVNTSSLLLTPPSLAEHLLRGDYGVIPALFEHYAENDARKKPEQIRRALFPCVAKTKRELKVNDEFEEDEVGVRYGVLPLFE